MKDETTSEKTIAFLKGALVGILASIVLYLTKDVIISIALIYAD